MTLRFQKKFSSYSGKGGGKGDKIANGRRSTVSKEPQPLELKVEQDLPENVKCMMDCEALDILQGIQDQLPILSKDPEFRLPVPFDKGLQYAKRGVHYANPHAVRQVLEDLTKYGVSNSEICVIANVCPESDEEVFSLLPSLKVCGFIHTIRHEYLAALDRYMKDVDEPIHAFSFINKTFSK
ncbi:DNA-directed RNA polymerases IV and V subunit 4-like [Castanea sativa]|uniref:DNA-directed RNA polymerases IV and V subunit 4-like n=1 Tax=Castanea sativa TaxID=21020 RepID=UPI003F64FA88